MNPRILALALASACALAACSQAQHATDAAAATGRAPPAAAATAAIAPDGVSEKAMAIHRRALNLDTHLDTPALFSRPGWDIADRHSYADDGSQVDYPRMVEGGLDGGFWAVYTGQGPRDATGNLHARDFGLRRLSEIREMVAGHADTFELATRPEDAARIKAAGKRSVYISMENAYQLEYDPSLLSFYYQQGLRMLSLVHTTNNDFADSSTDPKGPEWHGISPAGRKLVEQANKLGILLDQSHASNDVFDQMIALSKAPIILSHTAAFDVNAHPRNLDDARIRTLAEHGGVIQVNSLSGYLVPVNASDAYKEEMKALFQSMGERKSMTPEQRKALMARRKALDAKYGIKRATFDDYMKHVLHIIEVAGPEHVGLGADWDGGGGVDGYDDIAALPKVTQRLLDAGYDEKQIDGILGGNVVRLLETVQNAADPEAVKAALE